MTTKQILSLLDPKNQNLPTISVDSSFKKYNRINLLVFEGKEKDLIKDFPCLKNEKISGKKGELQEVFCKNQSLWIHGAGKEDEMTSRKIRRLFGKLYLGSITGKPKKIAFMCPADWAELAVLAIHVAALNPGMLKAHPPKDPAPEVVLLNKEFKGKTEEKIKADIKKGAITAEGKNLMRVLGALPPNVISPESYAEVIKALAKQWKVSCKQASRKELQKYELLNAVSNGSGHNSQLLILTLHPKKKTKDAIAVIGKGLCYDSGGLQDKQFFMKYMKEDMAGSASVLGTILDIVKNKKEVKETTYFLLPLAESMMGSDAMRADDVWISGDGQKVEIIHTDAEGRLVLADAICYAKNNFKNTKKFVTIATLTGSCIIALGSPYTGAICNDEDLKVDIANSSDKSGDFVHFAPWDMDYDDCNSPHAEVANLGEADREAGWIKGGLFLARFLPKNKDGDIDAKFCHLDIAGTIDMKETGRAWRRKGFSSGVGVGLLSDLLAK